MEKTITIDYSPMPHQRLLHDCQTSLIAVCGRQVGKTVCAVNELIKRAISKPNSRNWYITNDYKQAKRNVWDLFRNYLSVLPKDALKFNNSELKIEFHNNSKIELIGVENLESLRGARLDFAVLDEYADFPMEAYEKVIQPMFATTGGNVWFMGTPKGLGNDMYQKWQNKDNGLAHFKFPACRIDNGLVVDVLSSYALQSHIQEAYNNDHTPNKEVFNQEYLGDFTRPSGTVYGQWNIDHYVDLEYDPNLPLHLSFDFGINDPTAIIWIQPNKSETRVIDCYEATDANIEHFVQVINAKPYKVPDLITGDIAGRARELGTGQSVIEMLEQKGLFVRTTKIPSIPYQIRVTHGRINGLWVAKKASRFYECILNYRYPVKADNSLNQSNEIPIHDQFSHMMRSFEYWCVNTADTFTAKLQDKIKPNSGAELIDLIESRRRSSSSVIGWR